MLNLVRGTCDRLAERRQQRARHEEGLRPAVIEHVRIVVGRQKRIDRDGNHAGMQRAQKRCRKIDGVVQADKCTLIAAHPEMEIRRG